MKATSKRLRITPDVPLAQGLLGAWCDMLGHAFVSAAEAEGAPVVAVHEFRKSIRRCRAVLRLLRHIIPRDIYQHLRVELRRVHRATSSLRDRDVVLQTLRKLPLAPESIELVCTRIERAAPISPERAVSVLAEIAPQFEAIEKTMKKALRGEVYGRELEVGLRMLYRLARRDMRNTEKGVDDESLHDWRKRTKELKYLIELLTEGGYKGEGRILREQFGQLNQELGHVVDFMVLEDYVREHMDPKINESLLSVIASERGRHREMAIFCGHQLFARKAKKFAQELMQISKHSDTRLEEQVSDVEPSV